MLRSRIWFLGLVLSLCLPGCKAKPGDKCTGNGPGLPSCADPNTAFVCANGVVTALACRGPKACTSTSTQVDCDNSLANLGDSCDQADDVACAVDKKSALTCQNGKFALAEPCKGARGCTVDGNEISCDNDVSDVDDPCRVEGDYACTSDKTMVLKCVNKKFTQLNACRGKDACRIMVLPEEKKVDFVCDDSLAKEGDPCDTENEGACSMDKTEYLHCQANKFVKDKSCPGGCTFDDKGEQFECAQGGPTTTAGQKSVAVTGKPTAVAAKPAAATSKPAPKTAASAKAVKPAATPASKKKK